MSGLLKIGYIVKMFPRLSETFILNEILELERKGAEVTIFSIKKPNDGRFHPQLSSLKAKVIYLDELDPKKWPAWIGERWQSLRESQSALWDVLDEALQHGDKNLVDFIWWSAWVAVEARKLGLSHLHAHFATAPSTVAYFTHRISGIPFSFTAHAKDIYVYTMEETLLKEKINSAFRMITVTEYNKRSILERAPELDPGKIQVLYNGIDLNRFSPRTDRPGGASAANTIVGVGRLVPKKGFETLIDACRILKDKGVRFRCVIAGDGELAMALEEKRKTLGLVQDITLPGAVNSDEVLELIQSAAVVCLPCAVGADNNVDALPTVLLESLACGIPAISTSISGIPEIIDSKENGFLVEPDQAKQLADSLEKVLADPALRKAFGASGRQKAEREFDLKKNVGTLLEMFVASVSQSGPARVSHPVTSLEANQ